MRILFFILFFAGTNHTVLQGSTVTDSLKFSLQESQSDSTRAILFLQLAKSLQFEDVDSALIYGHKGLDISQKIQFGIGTAENAGVLGDLYVTNDDLETAKKYYFLAIDYFERLQMDFEYTQTLMVVGNIYTSQNNYVEALKVYQECLDRAEANKYLDIIPHLYNNIGVLYMDISDYEAAFPYFEKAHSLFSASNDQYSKGLSLNNIAIIQGRNGLKEEAKKRYFEGIRVFSELGYWVNVAAAYNSISEIYLDEGNFKSAEENLNIALNIVSENKMKVDGPYSVHVARILTTSSKLKFKANDFEAAKRVAKTSFEISNSNGYLGIAAQNTRLLSEVFEKLGDPDSALFYFKKYIQLQEDLQYEKSVKQITQLQMQYAFDAKLREKELVDVKKEAIHQKKEYTYLGIIGVVIFSVVLLILLFLNQKIKIERANLTQEKLELERTQLSQELKYKSKELTTNMMYLVEKNEFINAIANKLNAFKNDMNKSKLPEIQQIINELRRNTSKKAWEEFEILFNEVHTDFYDSLNAAVPDISPNEKRISAFLKLNMSTKEISEITHQSVKTINMARFRLRKKLNLDRDENLISFLGQL